MSSTTIPPAGRALNTADVCAKLGYRQTASVIRLVNEQGLPATRINGRYIFTEADVDAWREKHRLAAESDTAGGESPTAPTQPAVDVDPTWVAEQVAKFTPDDLRRAGELLMALSRIAADKAVA